MVLTEDNFLVFAMRNYDKVSVVSLEEFEEDLRRIKYIKKLMNRYIEKDDLNEKLILNHLIILHNVFGIGTSPILYYRIEKKYWSVLTSFLYFMNRLPEYIPEVQIYTKNIELDNNVLDKLELIYVKNNR